MTLNPAYVRNIMRYVAGALVSAGILSTTMAETLMADPMIQEAVTIGLGLAIGGITELFYKLAHKYGWRT